MRRFLSILRSPVQQKSPSKTLSENEIRALSREQLVKYALDLSQNPSSSPPPVTITTTDRGDEEGRTSDTKLVTSLPTAGGGDTDTNTDTNTNNGTSNKNKASGGGGGPTRKKRKRKNREFDWTKYGVRTIALRLSYLGWDYHGFASQPHSENTVEHHLFAALQKTYLVRSRDTCRYSRAGRTDVGVSARTQVVGITVRSNVMEPSNGTNEFPYARILNAVLPHEIRVTGWFPVVDCTGTRRSHPLDPPEIVAALNGIRNSPDTDIDAADVARRPGEEFSARFDASWRAYKYHFIPVGLDLEAMKAGCRNFVGRHNFINFCKIDENVRNFERLMYEVDVVQTSSECYLYVRGQAFLWHQVRCMVAILFEIAKGNETPDIITRMLRESPPFDEGKPAYRMASPIPLVLDDCYYPKSVLQFPARAHGNGDGDGATAKLFAQHALKARVIRGFMHANNDDEDSYSYILDSKVNRSKYTRLEDRTMEKRKTNTDAFNS